MEGLGCGQSTAHPLEKEGGSVLHRAVPGAAKRIRFGLCVGQ